MFALRFLMGCGDTCQGAACDDLYGDTLAALHAGGGLPEGAPTVGSLRIDGATLGQGWSSLLLPDQLLVGIPELGVVVRLDPSSSAEPVDLGARVVGQIAPSSGEFGAALALLGDGALAVGAPAETRGDLGKEAGSVTLFDGLAAGLDGELDLAARSARVSAEAPYDHLGAALAACGDLDGDGGPELLVGSPWNESGAPLGGAVRLLSSTTRAARVGEDLLDGELETTWQGDSEGGRLGEGLACGDLDGDGRDDPVLAAPRADAGAGAIFLLRGALTASGALTPTLSGAEPGGRFGAAIALGDLDGDGQLDLAVGAPGEGEGGRVQVWFGVDLRAGGLEPGVVVEGSAGEQLGADLALADLDGDGDDELVLGAPYANPSGDARFFASGAVYVLEGGLSWTGTLSARAGATTILEEESPFLKAGGRMDAGDLDGDGDEELLLMLGQEG